MAEKELSQYPAIGQIGSGTRLAVIEAGRNAQAPAAVLGAFVDGQIDASGLPAEIDALKAGQQTSAIYANSLSDLQTIVGTYVGQGAFVNNEPGAGQYIWNGTMWQFSRSDMLSQKADASRVSALEVGDFTAEANFRFSELSPDSGYAWALTDQNARAALLVKLDGTIVLPKFDRDPFIARPLNAETGFVWAVVDSTGRVGLGIRTDGTVVGKIVVPDVAGSAYLLPKRDIWCLGDSLTAGAGGQETWVQRLAAHYPDRRISNWGIGGQTSTQIAARAGAFVSLLKVIGDQIPATGAAQIAGRSVNLLTAQGSQSIRGWLGGVYGTLARNSTTDAYTFTRSSTGSAKYLPPNSPFVPDVENRDFETMIIFLGRNNIGAVDEIKRDVARCVALQKTAEKRFLIITPPNGGTQTSGQSTSEGTGSFTLQSIKAIEDWAVQEYGDRVLKVREYSFQFNDGSADDVDDVTKEAVPRSLRIDGVHWTTNFHIQVFNWINNEIARRGW
ncbi:MAG: SGNH/GDSL hydrolase family protein [Stenotrophomonas maltophilia]